MCKILSGDWEEPTVERKVILSITALFFYLNIGMGGDSKYTHVWFEYVCRGLGNMTQGFVRAKPSGETASGWLGLPNSK